MAELKDGCVTPVKGPIVPQVGLAVPASQIPQELTQVQASVGKEAVDFEASAFIAGEGFKPVKLSDYRGQWIVICFYPGDFTFV